MKSIELNAEQQPYVEELERMIQQIKDAMSLDITETDIHSLIGHLKFCQALMATEPRIMELASLIFGHVKGLLIERHLESGREMKVHEFRMWCDGKLTRWESLSQKAERTVKALDRYNENMRTLISAEKELAKHLSEQT